MEVTIGGNRLGSGNKMKVNMKTYERSTHDLSFVWRSTMAAGTLVPFWTEVALPGDTFDIDLNVDVLTHPTIGPLFGSYKIQLDVFQIPIRLYQARLHMNMLGIGLDMSQIGLPKYQIVAPNINQTAAIDNQQVNPSSIFSYLGVRGLGWGPTAQNLCVRLFNAVPWLAYWDIYKNYYANKQEEMGRVIHRRVATGVVTLTSCDLTGIPNLVIPIWDGVSPITYQTTQWISNQTMTIKGTGFTDDMDLGKILIAVRLPEFPDGLGIEWIVRLPDMFQTIDVNVPTQTITATYTSFGSVVPKGWGAVAWVPQLPDELEDAEPDMVEFPLANIDQMRQDILADIANPTGLLINNMAIAPYGLALEQGTSQQYFSCQYGQEGLALKTYQSDLFNNWISTEWIDGPDGISAITAIDTSGGSFTIDELNLSSKIYNMLNRIAISGGSYDDWLDAVYTHERTRSAENPMYIGGLMRNLIFQEVVSNAKSEREPLGTLAGKGKVGDWKKGGQIVAKIDEPSYLMGIISITPNIDYSQGNKWDVNLKTMNDLHKPALDEIGFQDLITDQMAWFDTQCTDADVVTFKSAGKQPAWTNYMTNVDVVKGNFADVSQQMFMVLARRYSPEYQTDGTTSIKDLTTYIDPSKFNHIFADTRRDAQNFWAQIGLNITARRKMSAKLMPNL